MKHLRRSPGFVLGAAATVALGVGITIAVFASVDRVLFRALPYPHADWLMVMQQVDLSSGQRSPFLPARYVEELEAALDIAEDVAMLGDSSGWFDAPGNIGPEVRVSFVTHRMLHVAGVEPVLGRGFSEEDARFNRQVVLLTFEAWQGRFSGAADILERRLWLRDRSMDIIGVLPPGYIPSGAVLDPDVAGLGLMPRPALGAGPATRTFAPTIRLRHDISPEIAQAKLDVMVQRVAAELPTPSSRQALRLVPLRDAMFGQSYTYLWLVTGAAVLVLVITAINLAGLFIVRDARRVHDQAIRISLGASRARLVKEAAAEGALVGVIGAVAALVLLAWNLRAIEALLPPLFGRYAAGVDSRVVMVALATAVSAGLAASVGPVFWRGRRDPWRELHGDGPSRHRRGRWILAIEAGVGVVLVAAAVITARNLTHLTARDLGFDATNLHLVLARSAEPTPAARWAEFLRTLDLLRSEPGVINAAGAAAVSVLRMGESPLYPGGPPCCRWMVTGQYFETVGIPVLAGRSLTDADGRTQSPVAVLNTAAVATLWPGTPPAAAVGRRLTFDGQPARTVVGVVGTTRRAFDDGLLPAIFEPFDGGPLRSLIFVARSQPGTLRFNEFRPKAETASTSLLYIRPMSPMYARVLDGPRFRAWLFGTFGLVALLVAMVGLYAITSLAVANRRRELGIRAALGASRQTLRRLVLFDTAKPIVSGVTVGLAITFAAVPVLQSFLHEITARDPVMFVGAAGALLLASGLAAWAPASRAGRVNPIDVLKAS